jgi:hypothetical protein
MEKGIIKTLGLFLVTVAVFLSCAPEENKSSIADLSMITVSGGILTPSFNPSTTAYTVGVPNGVTSSTISCTTADDKASVSYSPANPVNLNAGASTKTTIRVTAEDGAAAKDYEILFYSNMLINGGFDEGIENWEFWVGSSSGAVANADYDSSRFILNIESGANNESSIGLRQTVSLLNSSNYLISFDASSTVENCVISVGIQEDGIDVNGDGKLYSNWNRKWFNLKQDMQNHSGILMMSPQYNDPDAGLYFYLDYVDSGIITIDNILLTKIDTASFSPPGGSEMIWNGDFAFDLNFWWWWSSVIATIVPDTSTGKFIMVNPIPGTNRGNMCMKSRSKDIVSNTIYDITLTASSTVVTDSIKVTLSEDGVDINSDSSLYSNLDSETIQLTTADQNYLISLSTIYDANNMSINIYFTDTQGTISLDNVSMKPRP